LPERILSHPTTASPRTRTRTRTRRFNRPAFRALACFIFVAIASLAGGSFNDSMFLWLANGVLLAYLLLAPRRSWALYILAGILAHLAAAPFLHLTWRVYLISIPHDIIEVLLAAILLRRRSAELPNFTSPFYLLRFIACAVLAAPLISALIYAAFVAAFLHQAFLQSFAIGFAADSLGFLVTTPAFVAVFRSGRHEYRPEHNKDWFLIVLVISICTVLLGVRSFVGPSLLFPLLTLILLLQGLAWASFATVACTAIGAWYIGHGLGPFVLSINAVPPILRLQGFIISVMVLLYGVSIAIENLRKTERHLQEIANLHALVAENSRDVILLLDFQGSRKLISFPDGIWGGWSRDDIRSARTLDLIHDDERARVCSVFNQLRSSREGALIETRIRRKDDSYAWVEASLRTVRDPITNLPTGILANIREITERKQQEKQLEDAFHAVEELSITDPLTGMPNRRRFDHAIAAEWRRALREQNPLSLLLIDADQFKSFNDIYGHPAGDLCLKRIADEVRAGATRSGDLAARIGGEEFAILLPHVSGGGARAIASRICDGMRAQAVPHSGSANGIMTISVGCATVVPQPGQTFSLLIDFADQALYAAKHAGRNCVQPFGAIEQNEVFAISRDHAD
jgi:diguanylate cyclase (GGDEF)-like protein/PAS domain S-box-containing protein